MTFKIYTENKNLDKVIQLASNRFPGFTLYKTIGVWQGKAENSIVIEIVNTGERSDGSVELIVHALAEDIRVLNEQDAVLVTASPSGFYMISALNK